MTNGIPGVGIINFGATGDGISLPDNLTDSSGKASNITFEFQTSGVWGAGTGIDQPVQKMLNGIVGPDGPGNDQPMTFHNVPAGKHSVLVYCVAPPLNLMTLSYAIGTQKYYVRVMNSDEYKAAPGFYRGTSTDPKNPSVADFVRFDNVQPDARGDIRLTYGLVATAGAENIIAGVNAIQLVLDPPSSEAPTMSVTRTPTGLTLTYTGTLTAADRVNGPYSDVAGARSPYAVAATGTAKFYQARQ